MRPHLSLSTALRDDRGFSMVVVMVVLLASSIFVAGAMATAEGDLPLSADSRDRKLAYAAAEAGLNLYQSRLNADNEYWTRCANVPAPNATEANPVNQVNEPNRRWRKLPAAQAEYSLTLLPAPGHAQCVEKQNLSMIDPATATFKVRSTGRAMTDGTKRSIVATFRRLGFLDFIYFTKYETSDPVSYPPGQTLTPAWAQQNCADKVRAKRHSSCREIDFVSGDEIKGPFYTGDDIRTCGTPMFGRDAKDAINVYGPGPSGRAVDDHGWWLASGCTGRPTWQGVKVPKKDVEPAELPDTNAELAEEALDAYTFTGKTTIVLRGDVMDVTRHRENTTTTMSLPSNGVIYVQNGNCAASLPPPIVADYNESSECANLYVRGSYKKSLTLASANDIIVNGNLTKDGDPVLGLIADNFVRVAHQVNRKITNGAYNHCVNVSPEENRTIDAAILSLRHSFTVDNYSCGDKIGTLSVNGAIAQKYRGPVGTRGGPDGDTGYIKDYEYDDRLRYRSPPHFLTPLRASWRMVRVHEEVPAR